MHRAVCVVPGCSNSSAKFAGYQYICGPHWRMIPKALKRFDRELARVFRRCGLLQGETFTDENARHAYANSWRHLVRAAIEAAAGL